MSAWAQYRRFVADVPPDQPQVLSEAHMQASNAGRVPRSVMTPTGPIADGGKLWSGQSLYQAANISAATLLVRGELDSVCTDTDAQELLNEMVAARVKVDEKIPRATHLMHLEQQRTTLYALRSGQSLLEERIALIAGVLKTRPHLAAIKKILAISAIGKSHHPGAA